MTSSREHGLDIAARALTYTKGTLYVCEYWRRQLCCLTLTLDSVTQKTKVKGRPWGVQGTKSGQLVVGLRNKDTASVTVMELDGTPVYS